MDVAVKNISLSMKNKNNNIVFKSFREYLGFQLKKISSFVAKRNKSILNVEEKYSQLYREK